MITLHSGPNLLLKLDSANDTLILDVQLEGRLTKAQIRQIDKLAHPASEDSWFAEAAKQAELLAMVREIDRPKETWTSRAERERAEQQRIGGR